MWMNLVFGAFTLGGVLVILWAALGKTPLQVYCAACSTALSEDETRSNMTVCGRCSQEAEATAAVSGVS